MSKYEFVGVPEADEATTLSALRRAIAATRDARSDLITAGWKLDRVVLNQRIASMIESAQPDELGDLVSLVNQHGARGLGTLLGIPIDWRDHGATVLRYVVP